MRYILQKSLRSPITLLVTMLTAGTALLVFLHLLDGVLQPARSLVLLVSLASGAGLGVLLLILTGGKQRAEARRALAIVESTRSTQLMMLTTDERGIVTWVNERFERRLGRTGAQVIGSDLATALEIENDPEALTCIESGFVAGQGFNIDTSCRDATGKQLRITLEATRVAAGTSDAGFVIRAQDITRLHEAEKELRRLSLVAMRTDNAVIITDATGSIEWVNDGFTRISEYTIDEVIGKRPGAVLQGPGTDPETVRYMQKRLRAGRGFSAELVNYSKSGREYWLAVDVQPVHDGEGNLTNYIAVESDITENKRTLKALYEAEAFARLTIDALDARIAILDHEGRIIATNRVWETFEKEVGNKRRISVGDNYLISCERDTGPFAPSSHAFARGLRAILAGETSRIEQEYPFDMPDGRRWYTVRATPFLSDTLGRIVVMHYDTTARKQTEIELQNHTTTLELTRAELEEQTRKLELANHSLALANDYAQAANRAKSAFLANMSHEIRTPMTAILGYADLLAHRDSSEKEHGEFAETIIRNARHLMGLLDEILDLSKIEAGRMSFEREPCSIVQMIDDVLAAMQHRAMEKGLALYAEFKGMLPGMIETDPKRLRQVLFNLIGNAVKFTEEGEVRVVTRMLRSDDTAERMLHIEIIDTGIGMTPDQIARLFEPFTQVDTSMTRRYGGSGLGLAISKRIMQGLGGSIEIDSTPGHGSRFYIALPAVMASGTALTDAESIRLLGSTADRMPGRVDTSGDKRVLMSARILIAEDGPDNRRLVRHHLERAGATVTVACNGREAVDLALRGVASGSPFDIILMDMQMPEMDGLEAVRALRGSGYDRPIIALTAHAMADDRAMCLEAGCDGYLAKPVGAERLVETCRGTIAGDQHAPV